MVKLNWIVFLVLLSKCKGRNVPELGAERPRLGRTWGGWTRGDRLRGGWTLSQIYHQLILEKSQEANGVSLK